ncbi:MAG: hypothetical protein JSS68_15085 [Actinobacteria bacterium]|nr:hypothetical protein [Actinomycetota bacterium]
MRDDFSRSPWGCFLILIFGFAMRKIRHFCALQLLLSDGAMVINHHATVAGLA